MDIVDNELLTISGRLNTKLLKSTRYEYVRDMIYQESDCLDDRDNIVHRLRWLQLGYTNPPICKICSNRVWYQKQTQEFNTYCSPKCRQSDDDVVNKAKYTNLKRYGVEYGCVAPESRAKQSQTNLERYGVEKPFQSDKIQQIARQTTIEKYGVNSTALLPDIREKQIQTRQSKYGVDFLFQSPDFQQKIKIQTKERYNGVYPTQLHVPLNIWNNIQDYNWLYNQYIIQEKTAVQISQELGISDTTIGRYLRLHEINIKQSYWYSVKSINWLESIMNREEIYIRHAMNGGEYKIPDTRYKADGYCKETNTIYEFHGDYWHGNPKLFESTVYNDSTKCTMGELYQKTLKREQIIKELGYNIVSIWEYDYEKRLD